MKKTLTLLALLGAVATTPLYAKEVWMKGVVCSDNTNPYSSSSYPKIVESGAYTFEKGDVGPSADEQCWAAAAADTLAWWQDRVEENGALIIQPGTPRGVELWKTVSSMFGEDGYPRYAMDYWIFGKLPDYAKKMSKPDIFWEPEHPEFNGYYSHVKGHMDEQNAEDYMMTTTCTVLVNADWPDDPELMASALATLREREKTLISLVENGWGLCFHTDTHAMAAYGFEVNEEGLPIKMWFADNNDYYVRENMLQATELEEELVRGTNRTTLNLTNDIGYGQIRQFTGIRTTGIQFDTYELTMKGEATDEVLFSHYLDLVIDGATDYKLQYDLRNAKDTGSPVTAKDNAGNLITTGDITLKKGQLSLVAGVEKYDGGGKTSGTITFEGSADTKRTLSVQHTDTIAKEIIIAAAEGNTLDVAEGKTAGFGTLSGKGNLDKTGLGAAEVTGAVTLQGDIRVHEGSFIFGTDATISETTTLTVDAGAHVRGKEGESLTLTIASGVHENNGVMSLATTMKGGVLKGSGTFASVTMDGGTLIVGNSPGRQEYLGDLTVNLGDVVFSVNGWETPATADNCGWVSNTYSNIVMDGGSLTLGNGSTLEFALGGGAVSTLLANPSTEFELTIATGFSNGNQFTSALLLQLAQQTIFTYSTEDGAFIDARPELKDGETLNSHITNLEYKLADDSTLCVSGVYWRDVPAVPEPTTGTLGLLALAALAARRRK